MVGMYEFGFERNPAIEKQIDRRAVLDGRRVNSISAYMDVLEELLQEHSWRDEFRTRKAVSVFLRRGRCFNQEWFESIFSEEERDYCKRYSLFLDHLEKEFLGERYSKDEVVEDVTHLLERVCEETYVPSEILAAIEDRLKVVANLKYRLFAANHSLIVSLSDYHHLFFIVHSSHAYKGATNGISVSIIVNNDNSQPLLETIESQTNVRTVSLRNEKGRFERVYSFRAIDWCIQKLGALIWKIDREDESSIGRRVRPDLLDCKHDLEVFKREIKYNYYLKADGLIVTEIKNIRTKIRTTMLRFKERTEAHERHHVFDGLSAVESFLRMQFKALLQRVELYGDVAFSLGQIKRNNTLYIASNKRGKSVEYAFGEENLSAILASNIRCMHFRVSQKIHVHCEALVGNGRSDISIYQGSETIAIIECKLAREGVSVPDKVIDALDQLYARYSENEFASNGAGVQLFLVVFTHDRSFRPLARSISEVLEKYAVRNNVVYEQIKNTENGVTFSYAEDRAGFFSQKKRIINLFVCNLEVDFHVRAKNRKNLKPYRLP